MREGSVNSGLRDVVTFSSKAATKLCRRSDQEAWSKAHGKDVAKTEDSLDSISQAVYELAQTGTSAFAETRKLVTAAIGLGISLTPKVFFRALSAYLQRDVVQSRVSPKEWVSFVTHETNIANFLERQKRRIGQLDGNVTERRKANKVMSPFNASVQNFLQEVENTLAMVGGWWQDVSKRATGSIGVSRVAQSLADIGCYSNPSEATAGIQRLVGTQTAMNKDDFVLIFVRGVVKTSLLSLAKVLNERWKGSGMSLTFQLSMLKKNLIMSGLKYKNSLLDTTLQSETVVQHLDEAATVLFPKARPTFPQYQQEMREVLVKRKLPDEPAAPPVQTERAPRVAAPRTGRTMSAGPGRGDGKDLYAKTLKEMQDVVSYIPDVNLFLVMAE